MASGPTITCVLCVLLAVCAASSQNRLARRIAALEETIDGMAERGKQQQHILGRRIASLEKTLEKQEQNISENSHKLQEEQDRRQILEQEISQLQVRLKQTDVRKPTPAAPSPSTNRTLPATPRHMSDVHTPRPTPKQSPNPTPPSTQKPTISRFIPLYDNIRLVGGSADNEGRVEVYHNDTWGTICDDLFTTSAASVVCHMLGYPRSGAERHQKAHFGSGSGLIWLDNVVCSGEEDSIEDCKHNSWGVSDCSKSEDVGVSCGGFLAKLPVRLVGGKSSDEGRVEIQYNNTWGTVCGDSWDVRDATVACRQLGHNSTGIPILDGRFGPGSGPIWMDDTSCAGNEAGLGLCPAIKWNNSDCDHSEDAGVMCPDVPVLRFTKVYGFIALYRVAKTANGAVVSGRLSSISVRTDGLLTTDRGHYWEMVVTWSQRVNPGPGLWFIAGVGVRLEGSMFRDRPGSDGQSWSVEIADQSGQNKWRYDCRHGGTTVFTSQTVKYTNSVVTSRLGFLLDPRDKTLVVFDVKNNHARICSFSVADVEAKPLVPVVRFASSEYHKSFRLLRQVTAVFT